jgi:hypothetical protein
MPTSEIEHIQDIIEKHFYKIYNIEDFLVGDFGRLYVRDLKPFSEIAQQLEEKYPPSMRRETPKLLWDIVGDQDFGVSRIPVSFFRTKDVLYKEYSADDRVEYSKYYIDREKISISDMLPFLWIHLKCNLEYYLEHKSELEADLGRPLPDDFNVNNEKELKKLEQELFYVNICKIFGQPDNEDDDKVQVDDENVLFGKDYMFKDFKILYCDGNQIDAVALRGHYYFLFSMSTS